MSVSEMLAGHDRVVRELRMSIMQDIRCAIPGIVTEYNPTNQTVSVQPSVRETTKIGNVQLPMLLDVPVFFPGGVGCSITYKVQAGDPCLVVFSDTEIDGWFQYGDIQSALIPRRHSISDGFAFVGFRPLPYAVEGIDEDSAFAVRLKVADKWITPLSVSTDGKVLINGKEVK